jgi:hypothetical protein
MRGATSAARLDAGTLEFSLAVHVVAVGQKSISKSRIYGQHEPALFGTRSPEIRTEAPRSEKR